MLRRGLPRSAADLKREPGIISRLLIAAALVIVLDQHGVPVQGPPLPVITANTGRFRQLLSERSFRARSLDASSSDFPSPTATSTPIILFQMGLLISCARKAAENAGQWRSNIGVGPDQNFSYIAQVRPRIALMTDIRRDNLVEHLLLKALFFIAHNRAEYLSMLVGRPLPEPVKNWNTRVSSRLSISLTGRRRSARTRVPPPR